MDCYNANPQSMMAAVGSFAARHPEGVIVLGDMLELGSQAEEDHRELGRWLAMTAPGIHLVAIGSLGHLIAHGALDAGLPATQSTSADTFEHARDVLCRYQKVGQTFLLKASRGARLERVWELLNELEGR